MSDNSAIEWTDATWNPTTGCTKVSPGCDNCYAERIVERFRGKVPFFFKQWGAWQNGSADRRTQRGPDHVVLRDGRHVQWAEYADSDLVMGDPRQRHGACVMARVGKKAAGRQLDGCTWDEYPRVAEVAR